MGAADADHDTVMPARERAGWLLGRGDLPLFYRTRQPDTSPRGAVLITHGLGDHSGRYQGLTESLVAEGYAVFALDQRGHGRSAGPRTAGDLSDSVADLSTMVALVRQEVPDRNVFLIGHSWGGMVTLTYAVDHQDEIDGIILSSPAVRTAHIPSLRIFLGKVLARIAPHAGVVTLPYAKACSDPRVVDAQRNDPLTYQGPVKARMARQTLTAINHIAKGLPGLTVPIQLLHGTDDQFGPPSTSQYVHDTVGSQDRTIHLYKGLWHQLFNEPERETVYADVKIWLNRHTDSHVR